MKNFFRMVISLLILFLVIFFIWAAFTQQSANKAASKSSTSSSSFTPAGQAAEESEEAAQEASQSTPEATSAIDDTGLANGDYSSLAGTWADANGRQLIIDSDGQVDLNGLSGNLTVGQDGKGETLVTITFEDDTNLTALIYKAGQEIPSAHFQSGSDSTDHDRDRLIIPTTNIYDQEGTEALNSQVLYRN